MLTTPIFTDPFHPHLILHKVEGGSFMMGGSDNETIKNDKPVHKVMVPTFYMGKFTVTQSLWEAVMGSNPSYFEGEDRPVESVSWLDIVNEFLPKINQTTGQKFRLPTEAEWEFAGRGGLKSEGFLYCGSDKLKQVAWFEDISDNQTHPVGQKKGNELGLYDMSGNVWEWCADHWHVDYYGAPVDGRPWLKKTVFGLLEDQGASRVLRGGGYFGAPQFCRAAYRGDGDPDNRYYYIGFRLALSPS